MDIVYEQDSRNYYRPIYKITAIIDGIERELFIDAIARSDYKFHIDYTAIVTAVNGYLWSDILLTYRSTDRVDYPASNLIDAGYAEYAWSIG